MSIGIDVEHPVLHVHTQNGLAEAFIKRIQMIARTLVMRTKLPVSAWGYAILHTTMLVRLMPIATQPYSALQLVTGCEPEVSHLRIFGCAMPNCAATMYKMGPQQKMGRYVDCESPSILRFLEPLQAISLPQNLRIVTLMRQYSRH